MDAPVLLDKTPRDKIPNTFLMFLDACHEVWLLQIHDTNVLEGDCMRLRRILLAAISIAAVLGSTGCASPEEQQAYVRGIGDRELCMSWMTSASMNQYQSARIGEIRRRGLDCWKFGNVADEKAKAESRLQSTVNGLSGQQKARPAQVPMGVTNCINRGAGVFACSGPQGVIRCTDRGMGVLSCQ